MGGLMPNSQKQYVFSKEREIANVPFDFAQLVKIYGTDGVTTIDARRYSPSEFTDAEKK